MRSVLWFAVFLSVTLVDSKRHRQHRSRLDVRSLESVISVYATTGLSGDVDGDCHDYSLVIQSATEKCNAVIKFETDARRLVQSYTEKLKWAPTEVSAGTTDARYNEQNYAGSGKTYGEYDVYSYDTTVYGTGLPSLERQYGWCKDATKLVFKCYDIVHRDTNLHRGMTVKYIAEAAEEVFGIYNKAKQGYIYSKTEVPSQLRNAYADSRIQRPLQKARYEEALREKEARERRAQEVAEREAVTRVDHIPHSHSDTLVPAVWDFVGTVRDAMDAMTRHQCSGCALAGHVCVKMGSDGLCPSSKPFGLSCVESGFASVGARCCPEGVDGCLRKQVTLA